MKMDRARILSVVGAIVLAIIVFFAWWAAGVCHSAEWEKLAGSADANCAEFWINRYQTLIGALATLMAGYLAYRGAIIPAERAEKEAREAKRQNIDREFRRAARDVETLRSASTYLDAYLQHFDATAENEQIYDAFQLTRTLAADFPSTAANTAPGGFGERISTLMSRIDRLGVRIEEFKASTSADTSRSFFAEEVADAIDDLRRVHAQMRDSLPAFETELLGLKNQLLAMGGPIDYGA